MSVFVNGLCQTECGCTYIKHGDAVFLVRACDNEGDDPWRFVEGLRLGKSAGELKPFTQEAARATFAAWGELIADGYGARNIKRALKYITEES